MTAKIWNRISIVGRIAVLAGLILTVFRVSFGSVILIAGIVISAAGMIGTFRRAIKNPPRCPECGEALTNGGNRTRTSGLSGRSDIIICPNCGANVDLLALYKSDKI